MQKNMRSLVVGGLMLACALLAGASGEAKAPCSPVIFTADQDHQNMMDQLGIKGTMARKLRRPKCGGGNAVKRSSKTTNAKFMDGFQRAFPRLFGP